MARATRFSKVLVKNIRTDANTIAEVPFSVQAVLGQTGDLVQVLDSTGAVLYKVNAAGQLVMTAQASLATPFGLGGQLLMARAKYSFAVDGGVAGLITPATTAILPDNAIIVGGTINATTAVVGSSSTLAVGTSAGSSASALLAATAEASLGADVRVNAVPTFAVPVKLTAAGTITFTIGTANLTAGIVEATFFYFVAAA